MDKRCIRLTPGYNGYNLSLYPPPGYMDRTMVTMDTLCIQPAPGYTGYKSMADASHTVLDALVNTRSQCESLAKEAGLYASRIEQPRGKSQLPRALMCT